MARTLVIGGLKGGVGKTTTAISVAAALALRGRAVVLVDLDPQGSASLAVGHGPAPDPLFAAPMAVDLGETTGSLVLVPGGRGLASASGKEIGARLESLTEGGAEVMVVDTPPSVSPLTLSALHVADEVLVPLEPTPLSLPALRDLDDLLQSLRLSPRLRALMVRVQRRRLLTRDITELLEADCPGVLLPVTVPEDVRAAEAPGWGSPLHVYASRSRAAEAYRAIAEILDEEGA